MLKEKGNSKCYSNISQKAGEYHELLTPDERVKYQQEFWNVPTTKGTLAVHRSQGRGVRWTKINNRVYYRRKDIDWHFENAQYFETLESNL